MSTNTEKFMQSVTSKQIGSEDCSSDYFSESEEEKLHEVLEKNKSGTMDLGIMQQMKEEIEKIQHQQEVKVL
jgi:hypothetical protein